MPMVAPIQGRACIMGIKTLRAGLFRRLWATTRFKSSAYRFQGNIAAAGFHKRDAEGKLR